MAIDGDWKPQSSYQLPQQPVESDHNTEAGYREAGSSPFDRQRRRPRTRDEFGVVIICALKLEAEAFSDVFDQRWDGSYGQASWDPNAYSTGAIGKHNVVLAHMAGMGKANATSVAAYVRSSFPNIRLALVVGVCGAVPLPPNREAIVLGDVIISDSVFQYDLGRKHEGDRVVPKKELRESLRFPSCPQLWNLMAKLDTRNERRRLARELAHHITENTRTSDLGAKYREDARDSRDHGIFHTAYRHADSAQPCAEYGCNGAASQLQRLAQGNPEPAVHIGRLASGDSVIRSAEDRDELAQDGIIGLEMEGAGVWDHFPCLVIKGACDYADAGKTKEWQRYAAATAAACAKAFLTLYWEPAPYVG